MDEASTTDTIVSCLQALIVYSAQLNDTNRNSASLEPLFNTLGMQRNNFGPRFGPRGNPQFPWGQRPLFNGPINAWQRPPYQPYNFTQFPPPEPPPQLYQDPRNCLPRMPHYTPLHRQHPQGGIRPWQEPYHRSHPQRRHHLDDIFLANHDDDEYDDTQDDHRSRYGYLRRPVRVDVTPRTMVNTLKGTQFKEKVCKRQTNEKSASFSLKNNSEAKETFTRELSGTSSTLSKAVDSKSDSNKAIKETEMNPVHGAVKNKKESTPSYSKENSNTSKKIPAKNDSQQELEGKTISQINTMPRINKEKRGETKPNAEDKCLSSVNDKIVTSKNDKISTFDKASSTASAPTKDSLAPALTESDKVVTETKNREQYVKATKKSSENSTEINPIKNRYKEKVKSLQSTTHTLINGLINVSEADETKTGSNKHPTTAKENNSTDDVVKELETLVNMSDNAATSTKSSQIKCPEDTNKKITSPSNASTHHLNIKKDVKVVLIKLPNPVGSATANKEFTKNKTVVEKETRRQTPSEKSINQDALKDESTNNIDKAESSIENLNYVAVEDSPSKDMALDTEIIVINDDSEEDSEATVNPSGRTQQIGDFKQLDTNMTYLYSFTKYFDDTRTIDMDICQTPSPSKNLDEPRSEQQVETDRFLKDMDLMWNDITAKNQKVDNLSNTKVSSDPKRTTSQRGKSLEGNAKHSTASASKSDLRHKGVKPKPKDVGQQKKLRETMSQNGKKLQEKEIGRQKVKSSLKKHVTVLNSPLNNKKTKINRIKTGNTPKNYSAVIIPNTSNLECDTDTAPKGHRFRSNSISFFNRTEAAVTSSLRKTKSSNDVSAVCKIDLFPEIFLKSLEGAQETPIVPVTRNVTKLLHVEENSKSPNVDYNDELLSLLSSGCDDDIAMQCVYKKDASSKNVDSDTSVKAKATSRQQKRKRVRRLESSDDESTNPKKANHASKAPEPKKKRQKRKGSKSQERDQKNKSAKATNKNDSRELPQVGQFGVKNYPSPTKSVLKEKYITKAEYVKTFGRMKSPVNLFLSIEPCPKSSNIQKRRSTFTCEADNETILKKVDEEKFREKFIHLFGNTSEDEEEIIHQRPINLESKVDLKQTNPLKKKKKLPKSKAFIDESDDSTIDTCYGQESAVNPVVTSFAKGHAKKLDDRRKSHSTEKKISCSKDKNIKNKTVSKVDRQKSDSSSSESRSREKSLKNHQSGSRSRSKESEKDKHPAHKRETAGEPKLPAKIDDRRKSEKTATISNTQTDVKGHRSEKNKIESNHKKINNKSKKSCTKKSSSIVQNIFQNRPDSVTPTKKLTKTDRRKSAPDLLNSFSETTLIRTESQEPPLLIYRATQNETNESLESCCSHSSTLPTASKILKLITVENECVDTVYMSDSPEVKNDSTIVKQTVDKEDDDVIEVTSPVPMIDLTEEDGRDGRSTSPQETLADLLLKAKQEIQEIADENSLITLYRSEESTCEPEGVQAVSASISVTPPTSNTSVLKDALNIPPSMEPLPVAEASIGETIINNPLSNIEEICSPTNSSNNILTDNAADQATSSSNSLLIDSQTELLNDQHRELPQTLERNTILHAPQLPILVKALQQNNQPTPPTLSSRSNNPGLVIDLTNENLDLSSMDLKLVVEVFTRHIYFLAHLMSAQNEYVDSLNQKIFYKAYFKTEIELFEREKKLRMIRQSKQLLSELLVLNIRASRNLGNLAELIVERILISLMNKDELKRLTKSMIYLLIGELFSPHADQFSTVPLLKTLSRHCNIVRSKMHFKYSGSFTEEMRRTLVAQIEAYNRLMKHPTLLSNRQSTGSSQNVSGQLVSPNNHLSTSDICSDRISNASLARQQNAVTISSMNPPNSNVSIRHQQPLASSRNASRFPGSIHAKSPGYQQQFVRPPNYSVFARPRLPSPVVRSALSNHPSRPNSGTVELPGGANTNNLGSTPRYLTNYDTPSQSHVYASFGAPRAPPAKPKNVNSSHGALNSVSLARQYKSNHHQSRCAPLPPPIFNSSQLTNQGMQEGPQSNGGRSVRNSDTNSVSNNVSSLQTVPDDTRTRNETLLEELLSASENQSVFAKPANPVNDNFRVKLPFTTPATLSTTTVTTTSASIPSNSGVTILITQHLNANSCSQIEKVQQVAQTSSLARPVTQSNTQGQVILVNNMAASTTYIVGKPQTNTVLNQGLAALSSIGQPSAMLHSFPNLVETRQDQLELKGLSPRTPNNHHQVLTIGDQSPVCSADSSQAGMESSSKSRPQNQLISASKSDQRVVPKFKIVFAKVAPKKVGRPPKAKKSNKKAKKLNKMETVEINKAADINNELFSNKTQENLHIIQVPSEVNREYQANDDPSPVTSCSLSPDQINPSDSLPQPQSSDILAPASSSTVKPSVSKASDILGANNTGDEDDVETIDLTWIDEMDDSELQGQMDFVFVKQEHNENENVDGENNNLVPSPADSGIASPPHQNEEDTTYTVVRSLCICGQIADYNCACGDAWYCGPDCQLKDWESHERVCHIPDETSGAAEELPLDQVDTVQSNKGE